MTKTYNYKGKIITAQCGILYDGENFNYIDVGTFFIDEVSTIDGGVTITIKAYDVLGSKYADATADLSSFISGQGTKSVKTLLNYRFRQKILQHLLKLIFQYIWLLLI